MSDNLSLAIIKNLMRTHYKSDVNDMEVWSFLLYIIF
jgi:hypothetical protein